MVLVGYSDSESSEGEDVPKQSTKPAPKSAPTNFAVDKSNPKKIRVNLTENTASATEREDGEPAAKRPRVGAGVFSGFNAMLPPPKRDNLASASKNASKASTRKVFSLKTGAEPAFSRESDAELKEIFDGSDQSAETIPTSIPKPVMPTEPSTTTSLPIQGKPMMFKPLSVSRNNKKKKTASHLMPVMTPSTTQAASGPSNATRKEQTVEKSPEPSKKISLFSSGRTELLPDVIEEHDPQENADEDEIVELLDESTTSAHPSALNFNQSESLSDIASSLNLSAAEKRQLFGRNGNTGSKIINFNTDAEYAANQAHIAAGEQVQHNPVRAIASGKHSLKALVASAQGQKDALEESFASGRRNKREAGSKYGW